MDMTRLKTILNKYKETSMARPKFRMQETYADFSDEQMADMMRKMTESRGAGQPAITADMVNHPPHYTQGGMETIDIMEAKSTPEEFKGHLKLTAFKYLTRAGHKESELQDAKKTQWYVNKWVKTLEKEAIKVIDE
jgi:lipoate-protein ligase B